MKNKWNYIKAIALIVLVIVLYSFAKNRNIARNVETVSIDFTNGDNLYITETAVNKLLIQKNGKLENLPKDTLDLSRLEKTLVNQEMIADAEVYLTVDGVLGVVVTQRKPIARVFSATPFYIDSDGKAMPLSTYHSARVPILVGIGKKQLGRVFPLLKKIENDPFLKHHVVAIRRLAENNYELELRKLDFNVFFGKIESLDQKINNFKAFYKKAKEEEKLKAYKNVSLQFENQVVCTKK
ncbi:MAG TPA: hypothetical protein VFM65_01005 [Flavobacteriaceae bacterium]|nr:hypothetical protein [Flavobacteriaceae bacterium]